MASDFKDLKIWQEAYRLSLAVYKITAKFPTEEKFSLVDQLRRSSISVAANIAESAGRYHGKDKINLLIIARGSICETRSHLLIALGLKYLSKEKSEELENDYEILSKQTNSFIGFLKKQKSTNQLTNQLTN